MSSVGLCCLFFISVSLHYWVPAGCYANGKVTEACGNMEPHHGVPGQTIPSPYLLTTNSTTFSPGDHVQVILSGTSHFEGFLLQAKGTASQGSAFTVGTFTLTDPKRTQLLTCNKQQDSAVSHTSDARQKEVVVVWNAPQDSPNEVQFFVTVVAHYSVLWVKLPGPVIYHHGVTPYPPQSTVTSPPVQMTTSPSLFRPVSITTFGWTMMPMILSLEHAVISEPECEISINMFRLTNQHHLTPLSGLSAVSWRLTDGLIQCTFSRPVKLANPGRYDLDQEYFLFIANGHAQYGKIWKHSRQPLISTHRKRITSPPEILTGSRAPTIMKLHGALMLLAWMLTGSVGTFIASFYKPDWPNQTLLGQKVWFQVHRGLMILTVTLTIVAFGLPFFYRKGWSKHAGVHPYLGCGVLALSLIQPIIAAFRPLPDSDRRYIFNWAHWGVGSVTEIMAVAAMFLGMHQSSLLLPQPWAMHVLIGYVTWLALFRFLLLVHKHHIKKCTKTLNR
uniref:Ferric chelate reductase 1 n=1 Tax=Mastacembelus armatus TaxID=205130 RepID=A0A7N8Y3V0_9TELE